MASHLTASLQHHIENLDDNSVSIISLLPSYFFLFLWQKLSIFTSRSFELINCKLLLYIHAHDNSYHLLFLFCANRKWKNIQHPALFLKLVWKTIPRYIPGTTGLSYCHILLVKCQIFLHSISTLVPFKICSNRSSSYKTFSIKHQTSYPYF